MEKHITHTKALSRFIQILDGSFPSGSFIHSFGLEPHVVLNKVSDSKSLKIFLENLILDQYIKMEFVFSKQIYKLFQENNLKQILKEDNKYSAMLSFDFSKASSDLGYNYLKQINFNIEKEIVRKYFQEVKNKNSCGNELAILSAYAYELDFDIEVFLLLWCKKNIINISQSALKISRIKPSDIQKLLFEFDEKIDTFIKYSGDKIENFNPLFEEIIYQHKSLEPKLFVT
ncbi:MAG TPA: urease [Arcobacter sp.]|nr:urease [Arcobacter sp.]HIP56134.1 urease [Arcobacter sp.]